MLKKIFNSILLTLKLSMIRLSIGLHNAEEEILKADPNGLSEKNKHNQKVQTKNPLHRKMEQGERDEKYVQDYYKVLKKADAFMKNATPKQMEYVAMKNGMSLGKTDQELINVGLKAGKANKSLGKDRWGRRYDHFGFFDPKSKNFGKTMAEVMIEETKQRITKDEDFKIEFMFSNIPPTAGIVDNNYIVEDHRFGYRELNLYEKAKVVKYPMIVYRDDEKCENKIEQLTEYVHVKRLDEDEKIIEFFIPSKFKLYKISEDSDIFKEIININSVWLKDEYDVKFGYSIKGYHKRTEIIDESIKSTDNNVIYDVIKLRATRIENIEQ